MTIVLNFKNDKNYEKMAVGIKIQKVEGSKFHEDAISSFSNFKTRQFLLTMAFP